MIGAGLTMEQAPPFGVPLRFFLTAPLFLVAAGLLAAFSPDWSSAAQHPTTLALTHLLSLGVLGMVMFGAMTQMLPVVAGTPLPHLAVVAWVSHLGFFLGTPALAWGLAAGSAQALHAGAALISAGGLAFLLSVGAALLQARGIPTVRAMRVALFGLAATLALGLGMAAWLAGDWEGGDPMRLLARHAEMGLGVWIGALIMGSAWQVIPMLQLTPPYPAAHTRWLPWIMVAGLALNLLPAPWHLAGNGLLGAGLVLFALTTLRLLGQRKRKIPDVTLDFWRLGLVCLLASLALALAGVELMAGLLFLAGFALSVVNGMLYKIVPFLAWFHLQAQRGLMTPGLPGMKDYLPDRRARRQFRLHLAALACLAPAPYLPWMAWPGGLLLAASGLALGMNLLHIAALFRRREGRFS
ncbi:MAG: hypothetical protein HZB71_13110 [Betaproteobacteria bacterium]|nr:hypothetical protein [Betaproteobacteria bacterium]